MIYLAALLQIVGLVLTGAGAAKLPPESANMAVFTLWLGGMLFGAGSYLATLIAVWRQRR